MPGPMLAPDRFSMTELTKAILKVPYMPGLVGSLAQFEPRPGSTTIATIEMWRNRLALVPSAPRGGVPAADVQDRRELVDARIPHFPIMDTLYADEIQDVRAFGSPMQLESYSTEETRRIASLGRKLDVTLEWLRYGCICGVIITRVNRDTGLPEVTIPLWAMFNMVPPAPQILPIGPNGDPLDAASPWLGNMSQALAILTRRIEDSLDTEVGAIAAVCGQNFFDAVVKHPECRDAYKVFGDQASIDAQRGRQVRRPFVFRNVYFYEYRGRVSINGPGSYLNFANPDQCQFFPMDVPDLFFECYAPADFMETVNQEALPRYLKAERLSFDRGTSLLAQMDCLPLCSQPQCLIPGIMAP